MLEWSLLLRGAAWRKGTVPWALRGFSCRWPALAAQGAGTRGRARLTVGAASALAAMLPTMGKSVVTISVAVSVAVAVSTTVRRSAARIESGLSEGALHDHLAYGFVDALLYSSVELLLYGSVECCLLLGSRAGVVQGVMARRVRE